MRGESEQVSVTQPAPSAAGSKIAASSQLAARTPARPQPSAAPATRLHTPRRGRKRCNRGTKYLLGHFSTSTHVGNLSNADSPPFHATPSTTCKRLGNGSVPDHTYRLLTARASRSPTPSRGSLVSLRCRGSAFWRSRPGGFREPVRLSPGSAREYLGCRELQFLASIGPLAAGQFLRPPPSSGSRLPRFLLHLIRDRFTACFRMLSITRMRDKFEIRLVTQSKVVH